MDQAVEVYELSHVFHQAQADEIPWEGSTAAVDSRGTVPSAGLRVRTKYKDRYGRLHSLEDDVSYFIDPEDGAPKKVITQRSTRLDTVVGAAQSHEYAKREVARDIVKSLFGEDSWIVLAARAIRDRWSSDKDPVIPEDLQQLSGGPGAWPVVHPNTRWDRTTMKNKSSLAIQLIYWIYAGLPPELIAPQAANDEESKSQQASGGHASGQNIHTWADLWHYDKKKFGWFVLRYFIGTIGLTAMLIWPSSIEEPLRNGGYFDPIRYRDWDYPKNARNIQEEDPKTRSVYSSENTEDTRTSVRQQAPQSIPGQYGAESSRVAEQHFSPASTSSVATESPWSRRILPTHLCFRDERSPKGYERHPVNNLIGDETSKDFKYAFISYSRKQFFTQGEDEIQSWKQGDAEKGHHWSEAAEFSLRRQIDIDCQCLTRIALKAISESGLNAFYIDFECVDSAALEQKGKGTGDSTKQIKPDVYRICDAMRAAEKMILILGPRNQEIFGDAKAASPARDTDVLKRIWLQQWGSRLWTLPELLLAPQRKLIDIYYLPSNPNKHESIDIGNFRGSSVTVPSLPYDNRGNLIEAVGKESLTKTAFPSRAYETTEDAIDVAALVDHFEGTLVLPILELITHAAQALWRREKSTFKFLNGDCSYALMGLLRRRPPIRSDDKDFEAFARLSLANDSDRLLERVICLLPHQRSASWHDWKDAWPEVKLWDIEPITQVAAIADNSTVVLDGAYAATIHWRKLHPVAFIKRKTAWRQVTKFGIRLGALYFITAITLVAQSRPKTTTISSPFGSTTFHTPANHPLLIVGAILLTLTILVLIYAPWAMLKLYRGKFWGTQGWFFGIEGCADIGEVEKCLFGGNHNRLKWSTNGSMLSRHDRGWVHNEDVYECLPQEPRATCWDRTQFESQRAARGRVERLYTLIDTYSMEATLFWAEVPPTAVFICGSEGGMKRAMLCSFDWKTNSFVRETVVRMKTMVVDKMFRVERFRFAMSRRTYSQMPEAHEILV